MKKVNFLWKLKIVHFQIKATRASLVNKINLTANSQIKNFQRIHRKYFKNTNNFNHLELKKHQLLKNKNHSAPHNVQLPRQ